MANFNEAAVTSLRDKVISVPMGLGIFERVNGHEPKNAPGNGPSCSVWVDQVAPLPQASGLGSVTGMVVFTVRVYLPMLAEPQDGIDGQLLAATCALWGAYAGGFTLGGTVRDVDLFKMSAKAGYLNQDGRLFRVMDTTLPVVINDMFAESS